MAFDKPTHYILEGGSINDLQNRLGARVINDTIMGQLEELFLIRNPRFKFNKEYKEEFAQFLKETFSGMRVEEYGGWVFYPWSQSLIHILPEEEWFEVRTARNKNLVTTSEQRRFYDFTVGIAGLSVGSHIALTIAMMGGAKRMALADPDNISLSNINRIRAGASSLERSKIAVLAEQIYEINPYAELFLYDEGITEENVARFFDEAKVSALIEETDNLGLKISLRHEAKKRRIPVIMGTDNGDGAIIDVERYDTHTDLQLFNGILGDISLEEFKKFPPFELPKFATRLAGPELAVPRMKDSITEVGKTIYSWPQLGSAATLCGTVIAYIIRRIANDLPVKEGKFGVSIDAILDPSYNEPKNVSERDEHHHRFMKMIGLET